MADNAIYNKIGRTWFFSESGVYVPVTVNIMIASGEIDTNIDFTMDEGGTGLVDGAAISSPKCDLTDEFAAFRLSTVVEYQSAAPTAGTTLDFWWSPSMHATAANGNAGGVTGVEAVLVVTGSQLEQCQYIGSLTLSALTTHQNGVINPIRPFVPMFRYGCLIIHNNGGQTLCDTDAIESAVMMQEIFPEVQ